MARSTRRETRSAEYRSFMSVLIVFAVVGILCSISPQFEAWVGIGFAWVAGGALVVGVIYGACLFVSDLMFSAWLRRDNERLLAEAVERETEGARDP